MQLVLSHAGEVVIFQGLAISLMAGEIASLLLSRMTVPVVYYLMKRRELRRAAPLPPPAAPPSLADDGALAAAE